MKPVANALSASVSMIRNAGIVMPREIQRFSSRLYSLGSAIRSTFFAPVAASMMPW